MGKKKEEEKAASHVFVMDPDFGWRPAKMLDQQGGFAIVEVPNYKSERVMACDGGRAATDTEKLKVNLKDYPHGVLPLQNVDANGNLVQFADMVKLPYLHEVRVSMTCFVTTKLRRKKMFAPSRPSEDPPSIYMQ